MSQSLSVLHLLNSDHRRGAEVFALDLATAMAGQGVGVTVRSLSGSSAPNRLREVAPLAVGRLSAVRGVAELRRLARGHDVVVGHGGRTLLTGAAGTAGMSTPLVYRLIGDPSYWTGSRLQRLRVGFAMRRCAAVVAYYDAAASTLTRRYSLRPGSALVVGKGIDSQAWPVPTEAARREARRLYSLAESEPVLAYVGALSAEKNVGQLIRAVAGIEGLRLLIAGDGPERGSLESIAADSNARVDFVGAVTDPSSVYAAADVVGLTSRTEGVSTVILEAASCGVPIVATDVGGSPEVVTPEIGRLVRVDDVIGTQLAIRDVLEHKQELGETAAATLRARFDLKDVAREWITLLERVVERTGS